MQALSDMYDHIYEGSAFDVRGPVAWGHPGGGGDGGGAWSGRERIRFSASYIPKGRPLITRQVAPDQTENGGALNTPPQVWREP